MNRRVDLVLAEGGTRYPTSGYHSSKIVQQTEDSFHIAHRFVILHDGFMRALNLKEDQPVSVYYGFQELDTEVPCTVRFNYDAEKTSVSLSGTRIIDRRILRNKRLVNARESLGCDKPTVVSVPEHLNPKCFAGYDGKGGVLGYQKCGKCKRCVLD